MKEFLQRFSVNAFGSLRDAARWVGFPYLVVLVLAGVWMFFFDRYPIKGHVELNRQIEQLEHDKAFYEASLERIQQEGEALRQDPEAIERYARERYYMKRADEDVFVVE